MYRPVRLVGFATAIVVLEGTKGVPRSGGRKEQLI